MPHPDPGYLGLGCSISGGRKIVVTVGTERGDRPKNLID